MTKLSFLLFLVLDFLVFVFVFGFLGNIFFFTCQTCQSSFLFLLFFIYLYILFCSYLTCQTYFCLAIFSCALWACIQVLLFCFSFIYLFLIFFGFNWMRYFINIFCSFFFFFFSEHDFSFSINLDNCLFVGCLPPFFVSIGHHFLISAYE